MAPRALTSRANVFTTSAGVFARISAPKDVAVTAATAVEGAAGSIVAAGADHVDVAVRFEVAAQSCPVTVRWAAGSAETFVFRAEDLATRNLDYRTTFYVYDISPYVTWEYGEATGKYARNVTYFELVGGEYVAIDPTSYDLNADIPAMLAQIEAGLRGKGLKPEFLRAL